MRMKPTTTERASSAGEHFSSSEHLEEKQTVEVGKKREKSKRERHHLN